MLTALLATALIVLAMACFAALFLIAPEQPPMAPPFGERDDEDRLETAALPAQPPVFHDDTPTTMMPVQRVRPDPHTALIPIQKRQLPPVPELMDLGTYVYLWALFGAYMCGLGSNWLWRTVLDEYGLDNLSGGSSGRGGRGVANLKASDPRCSDTCPTCGRAKYRYSVECRSCRGSSRRGFVDPRNVPTETPDSLEIAWAAGFYEGEGTVGYRSRTMRVALGQKTVWPLQRIQRFFGGKLSPPTERYNCWVLALNGQLALNFIEAVEVHLSPRRLAQINEARARMEAHRG